MKQRRKPCFHDADCCRPLPRRRRSSPPALRPAAAANAPGRHRHRDQDRPDHALQRPGLRLRHDRQGRARLLQDDQRRRAASTAARSTSSASTTATARPRRSSRSRHLVEQDQVLFIFQTPRHAAAIRRSRSTSTRRRCRSSSSPPAPPSGTTPSTSRGPWAGSRTTRPRRTSTRKYILDEQARREDRRPLPERRLRQGLPQRPQGRPRRQGEDDDRQGGRPTRSPIPTVDSQIVSLQASGADVFFNVDDAEVRGAGDPQGLRHRLEAAALPQQRVDLGRLGAEAGGPREVGRPHHRRTTSRTRPIRAGRTTPAEGVAAPS